MIPADALAVFHALHRAGHPAEWSTILDIHRKTK